MAAMRLGLPGLFGLFACSTLATAGLMAVKPKLAWSMYGVKHSKDSLTSLLYMSALWGEATLQLFAWLDPEQFIVPALVFTIPYKLASVCSLLMHSISAEDEEKQEMRRIAFQWAMPLVMIGATVFLQRDRRHYDYLTA